MLPAELNAKYELRGTLGAGAMGRVYEATDRIMERRVAIKVVDRPKDDDEAAVEGHARFRREAQAAGRLAHPNIVGVYDYGENADQAWIVMELVDGGSLKGLLDKQERFLVSEIVRLMCEMLDALAFSHEKGVVHRDIKPANIMLSRDSDKVAHVKLADFGIARLENSSMTQVGTVMGTPSYMAPEQLRGEVVDLRADIWAAGVVLYQLLTGEKPFEGGFSAVMHKALNTMPTPPSVLSVTAPVAFDAVIAKALAKRPEDRFQSAKAFAEAIRAAAGGARAEDTPSNDATLVSAPSASLPVPGSPPPAAPVRPEALGAPAASAAGRRSPLPVALAAAIGLVAVVGGGAWFMFGGSDGRRSQEALRLEAENRAREDAERLARQLAPPPASAPATPAAAPGPVPLPPAVPVETRPQDLSPPSTAALPAPAPPPAPASPPVAVPAAPASPPALAAPSAPAVPPSPPASAPGIAAAPQPPSAAPPAGSAPSGIAMPQTPPRAPSAPPAAAAPASTTPAVAAPPVPPVGGAAAPAAPSVAGILPPPTAPAPPSQPPLSPHTRSLDDVLRPFLGNASAPRVSLAGPQPLAKGELLRFSVEMPAHEGYLTLVYLSKTGDAYSLAQSRREPAGARPRFGDPTPAFPGWEIDAPFGQDRLLALVTGQPLFAAPRPEHEPALVLGGLLAERLEALRARGVRVGAQFATVDTVERRVSPPVASTAPVAAPPAPAPAPPAQAVPPAQAAPPSAPSSVAMAPRAPTAEEIRATHGRAVMEAAQGLPCALLQVDAGDGGIRVAGLVRRGGDAALAADIARRGVPRDAVRLEPRVFDGPYCEFVELLRSLRRPDLAPRAAIVDGPPLAKGELLRLSVEMPSFDGQVSVVYLMSSGDAAHLVPNQAARGGARLRFGDPAGAFTGWEIDEPFGTDMILVVASDSPLFPQPRAEVEPSAGLVAALAERLRTLQARGAQIGAQLLPVETIPRR
jgi:serine/threonine-protein kinase